MRIALDLQTALGTPAGIGYYALSLARYLPHQSPRDDFIGLAFGKKSPKKISAYNFKIRSFNWIPSRGLSLLWKTFNWPPADFFTGPVDLFHFPCFVARRVKTAKSIVTVHDLAFKRVPELCEPKNTAFLEKHMPFTLERVDSVLTVSEFTAGELETFYGYPRECIRVTPLGVDSRFVPSRPDKTETVRMRYRLPRRYVLFVGTIEPRKNLSVLIKAYKLLQKKGGEVPGLVLVGADGWRGEAVKINRLIARFGLEGSVIRLGYVREEDLPALYGAADIFVFPSLYEGFGLPPLEAMACGTPVISSNAASLPEVLGDAALYVSPEDTNALAEAMARLLCDDELQNSMIDKGRDRAKRFTWPETARSTLCIYREVCSR